MKFFTLLFFFTLISYAQINSGCIEYKVNFAFEDSKVKNIDATGFVEAAITGSKNIIFSLNFNENYSCFKYNDRGIKSYEEEIALIFTNAENICFTDIKNKLNYFEISENKIFKKGEFILIDSIKSNWTITNETKIIDKYTCYKAKLTIDKSNSQTKKDVIVTAWFSPMLPYSFGPNGFSGLPGLILELYVNKTIFTVNKISIFKNEEIYKPSLGKEINFENYKKIIVERTPNFE
ncbi:GLPGLI family protein [Flavobacterium sp. j3]|uniref:GLPGLI family protein n=1 Tax=Flavobacterium aureirubrum TaxID=3133147 RepID=A0ABU9N844_9FLAO